MIYYILPFKKWLDKTQGHADKEGMIVFHDDKEQYNRRLYDECIAKEMEQVKK